MRFAILSVFVTVTFASLGIAQSGIPHGVKKEAAKKQSRPAAVVPKAIMEDELTTRAIKAASQSPEVEEMKTVAKEVLSHFTAADWAELEGITKDYWAVVESKPIDEKAEAFVLKRQNALFRKMVARAGYEIKEHLTPDNEYKAFIKKGKKAYDLHMDVSGIKVILKDKERTKLTIPVSKLFGPGETLAGGQKVSPTLGFTFELLVRSQGFSTDNGLKKVSVEQKYKTQIDFVDPQTGVTYMTKVVPIP